MTNPHELQAEDLLEHATWIRRLARRLVGEEAEDLVQDTWLAALRRPPAGDRPLRPWLAAVARNLALNRRRGKARRLARETAVGAEDRPLPTPEELLERGEEQRAVVEAVLGLDEPYRATLLLRYFEGLEPREIAARQGIPGATVRARLKRGLERVREHLDAGHEGDRARWVRALAPLAALDRGDAEIALASTTTATTLTMATTLKLAATTVLAAGTLGWFLRTESPEPDPLDAVRTPALVTTVEPDLAPTPPRPPGEAPTTRQAATNANSAAATDPVESAAGELLVLDIRTGEPVPDLLFAALVEEHESPVPAGSEDDAVRTGTRFTTDAAGRAELSQRVTAVHDLDAYQAERNLAGRVSRGRPSLGKATPVTWEKNEATLRLDIGPTYPLLLDTPPGLELSELFAVLTRRDSPSLWRDESTPIRPIAGRPAARFGPDPAAEGERVHLFVASDDGRWLGRGTVSGVVGVQPPIAVRVEECAILDVVVRGETGDAGELQATPRVTLFPGDVAWRAYDAPARHTIEPAGGTADRPNYRWLTPGPYTVVAQAPGHVTVERRLDLGIDGPGEVVLSLPREEELDGVIEGRIISRSRRYAEPLKVFAIELDPLDIPAESEAEVVWEDLEGELVGRFRVEGLPDRRHRLQLATYDGYGNPTLLAHATEPAVSLAEPGVPVEIVVHDDVAVHDVAIRLVDAETEAPIEAFTVTLFVEDASLPPAHAQAFDGEIRFERVPELARRGVLLSARGYRPRQLPAGTLDPGSEEAVFTLRPGWGAHVLAVGPEGPIAGARVLVDGAESARTDANGLASLDGVVAPERIEVRHGDWTLAGGPETDEEGRLVARERRSGTSLIFRFEPPR